MGPPGKGSLLVALLAACLVGRTLAALSECQPKTSGNPNYRYQCRQNYKDICTCPGGAPCNFGGGAKGANVYCKTECLPDTKGQLQCVANGVSVCNCPSISPTCTPVSRGASYCQPPLPECPPWDGESSGSESASHEYHGSLGEPGEWDCNVNCRCAQGTACDSDGGCYD